MRKYQFGKARFRISTVDGYDKRVWFLQDRFDRSPYGITTHSSFIAAYNRMNTIVTEEIADAYGRVDNIRRILETSEIAAEIYAEMTQETKPVKRLRIVHDSDGN